MLGDRLRSLREKKNLTQEQVSKHLGITRPAYTQYESGNRKPDPDTLAKLGHLYEVSIDYIVTGHTPTKDVPPEESEFIKWVDENLEGSFFYDFSKAPEESKREMMRSLRIIWELEKNRKPGDKQGE